MSDSNLIPSRRGSDGPAGHTDLWYSDRYGRWIHYETSFTWLPSYRDTQLEDLPELCRKGLTPEHAEAWRRRKIQPPVIQPSSPTTQTSTKSGLYLPIQRRNEIRVLELHAGEGSDALRGSLRHVELQEVYLPEKITHGKTEHLAVRARFRKVTRYALSLDNDQIPVWYSAVSYCWGTQTFDCSFHCDGHIKRITKSLDVLLRHLRRPDQELVLWIDQLCINQDDDDEKARQVRLMGHIYRQSFQTIIWIGESNDNTQAALDMIKDMSPLGLKYPNVDQLEGIGFPPLNSGAWQGIWDLLTRPWFTRLWTAQEVALPRTSFMMCGEHIVDWEVLVEFTIRLPDTDIQPALARKYGGGGAAFVGNLHVTQLLWTLKMEAMSEAAEQMEALQLTRHTKSWDPRDKIYGTLGMLPEAESRLIIVDYGKGNTPGQTYEQATAALLQRRPSHLGEVLACMDHDPTTTWLDLPSWVPDWSQPQLTSTLSFKGVIAGLGTKRIIYKTSGSWIGVPKKERPAEPRYDPTTKEISLRARSFDSILFTTLPFSASLLPEDPLLNKNNENIRNLIELTLRLREHPYGNDLFEPLWQTLVAGVHDEDPIVRRYEAFAEIFSLIFDEATGSDHSKPSLPGQTYSQRQLRPPGKGRLELSNLLRRQPKETYQQVREAVDAATKHRRLGVTSSGYLALVSRYAEAGDWINIFEGEFLVPYVVRPIDDRRRTFMGESYVQGAMNGEFAKSEDLPLKEIVLV